MTIRKTRKGKLKFGPDGIMNATPIWAKWVFRATTIFTTAIAFVVAGDPSIPDMLKVRILLYLKGIDIVVLGLSKMFGIEPDDKKPKPGKHNGGNHTKHLLLLVLFLLLSSCTRQDAVPCIKDSPILGRWRLKEDTSIQLTVTNITDTSAFIVYPFLIDQPRKGSIGIAYKCFMDNDTLRLTYSGIYPSLYFYYSGLAIHGMMTEFRYMPGQGSYKEIEKY